MSIKQFFVMTTHKIDIIMITAAGNYLKGICVIMAIKNVVFDIGKVLVDFAWDKLMEELGFSKECIDALDKGFINDPLWDQMDLGIMKEEEVIDEAVRRFPEYEKEIRCFYDNLIKTVRPYDYCVKWIKDLKANGYKVFLLTNYPVKLFDESVATSFPFYDLIDGKVVSSHINIIKPSEGIYKAHFEKYNLKAEECVFFDDRQRNVDAANRLGMHAFVFEGYEKALKDFEKATADNR